MEVREGRRERGREGGEERVKETEERRRRGTVKEGEREWEERRRGVWMEEMRCIGMEFNERILLGSHFLKSRDGYRLEPLFSIHSSDMTHANFMHTLVCSIKQAV